MDEKKTQQYYEYLKSLPMDDLDPTYREKMLKIVLLCLDGHVDLSDKNQNSRYKTGALLRAIMEQNWMIIRLLSEMNGKMHAAQP